MPQEVLPRPLDVVTDLVRQLQRRAELLLAPQELVEVEAHGVAIDVGVEVEDVALDGHGVVLVQRRAHADVGHALEGAGEALESRRRHVDAAARKELVERVHVDGREADLAAEAAAGGHAAVDEAGAAEGEGDDAHRPFGDRLADDGAGDADAADLDLPPALHPEALLLAGRLQLLQVTLPSRPEPEVLSD